MFYIIQLLEIMTAGDSIACESRRLFSQRAKKVVSNSPGLVDFAIGLLIFLLNLPDRQVLFLGEIQMLQKDCNQSC